MINPAKVFVEVVASWKPLGVFYSISKAAVRLSIVFLLLFVSSLIHGADLATMN